MKVILIFICSIVISLSAFTANAGSNCMIVTDEDGRSYIICPNGPGGGPAPAPTPKPKEEEEEQIFQDCSGLDSLTLQRPCIECKVDPVTGKTTCVKKPGKCNSTPRPQEENFTLA